MSLIGRTYFLSPGNGVSKKVEQEICSIIQKSADLRICIAYFTHPTIAESIIQRHAKKMATRIIINVHDILRPSGAETTKIHISAALFSIFEHLKFGDSDDNRSPLNVRFLRANPAYRHSHMHHKFIVGDAIVGFGSLNFTRNAFENNHEDFTLLVEKSIVSSFRERFSELWEIADNFNMSDGGLRSFSCPVCHDSGGIDFESYGASCINCFQRFEIAD